MIINFEKWTRYLKSYTDTLKMGAWYLKSLIMVKKKVACYQKALADLENDTTKNKKYHVIKKPHIESL